MVDISNVDSLFMKLDGLANFSYADKNVNSNKCRWLF